MQTESNPRTRSTYAGLTLFTLLALACTAQGQAQSDNFNSYNNPNDDVAGGWTHYDPIGTAPGNSDNATWTFPSDGPLDVKGYRISATAPVLPKNPQTGEDTGPARVGAFRQSVNYSDFTMSADIVNFDDSIPQNAGALAARISNPGLLTTSGYLDGYINSQDFRDQQGIFAIVEFQTELNVSAPDQFIGGAALVSRLDPARKYRTVFTGADTNLQGAIYYQTDLLEPIVKNAAINGDQPSGNVGLVAVNYDGDNDKPTDYTFDNYYSSGVSTDPIAFPGTPQVANLIPAPQTLFYSPPNNGSNITFRATTFSTTNQIGTNSLQLFLNGVDVSSQLVFNETGSGKTNFFVRYTGALAANTIYNGKIIVLNTNTPARGTTNTWVFDTFPTSGTVTIEAEDYNYEGGLYQPDPPVSGYTPDGVLVNGGGFGYFDLVGSPDIDYHDTATSINALERNQYRTQDYVGTAQGVRAGDTQRQKFIAANVPDYGVWRMQAGEWLNYTRTFPSANYNVYLRTSSQSRQDVRWDQIADATISNQVKTLAGQFLVPNTGSSTRYRYVPLSDAAGNPLVLGLSGVKSFRLTPTGGFDSERQHYGDDNGSLQPNYILFVPTTTTPPSLPWLASAAPSSGATDVLLRQPVQIIILNRTTHVNTGSIVLRVNGINVTGSSTISGTTSEGSGATITYTPPGFLQPNTTNTVSLTFADDAGTPNVQSNQWNFVTANFPVIPASFARGGSPDTNFSIQMVKAPNDSDKDSFPNSTYRAERQLANQLIDPNTGQPYGNECANNGPYGFYTETNAINYEQGGNATGYFGGDTTFPGIDQNSVGYNSGDPNFFAMAATIKLYLAAGHYRMGVLSDDGFKVTVGTNSPPTDLLLGRFEGVHPETAFDFVVAASGVYNFRLVYEEGQGGASVEWYWIDLNTGNRTLVVPTTVPTVQLYSATTVKGPFTNDVSGVIDTANHIVTVPKSGSSHFYRLSAGSALNITNITSAGGNMVLKYQ